MNPGVQGSTTAATMVVLLAGAARQRVIAHFLAQHATRAEDAVPYVPKNDEKGQFRHLIAKGVLRKAGAELYWLDRAALAAIDRRGRTVVIAMMALLLAVIAALVLFMVR